MHENFSCYSCKEIPDIPYESECCGKLYCQQCSEIGLYLSCQSCKSIIKFKVSIFAKNLMNKLETTCNYNCDVKYKINETKVHNLQCRAKLYKCKIKKCSFKGIREKLLSHLIEDHKKEILITMENFGDFSWLFSKYITKNSISMSSNIVESETKSRINNSDEINITEPITSQPKFGVPSITRIKDYAFNTLSSINQEFNTLGYQYSQFKLYNQNNNYTNNRNYNNTEYNHTPYNNPSYANNSIYNSNSPYNLNYMNRKFEKEKNARISNPTRLNIFNSWNQNSSASLEIAQQQEPKDTFTNKNPLFLPNDSLEMYSKLISKFIFKLMKGIKTK